MERAQGEAVALLVRTTGLMPFDVSGRWARLLKPTLANLSSYPDVIAVCGKLNRTSRGELCGREVPRFENSRNVEMRAALAPPVGSRLLLDQEANFPLLRLRSWG